MKPGLSVIAPLLLVLAILLELALVIHPPRLLVFPMRTTQGHGKGAPPSYTGLAVELEPNQLQAAKARMLRKLEEARGILAVAEEEEQQAEVAIEAANVDELRADPTAAAGLDHEVITWTAGIGQAHKVMEKAEAAVAALGDHAPIADLKRAGQLANECIRTASKTEAEMHSLKESWQREAERAHGGA